MSTQSFALLKADFRNFNLCPHCIKHGQEPLLHRLCEGMPMISRSDGETFHLLLADRPLPFPLERSVRTTKKISVCFWYTQSHRPMCTNAAIVILPGTRTNHPSLFRRIEMVADLLAEELCKRKRLVEVYELFEESEQRWPVPEYARLDNLAEPSDAHWI